MQGGSVGDAVPLVWVRYRFGESKTATDKGTRATKASERRNLLAFALLPCSRGRLR